MFPDSPFLRIDELLFIIDITSCQCGGTVRRELYAFLLFFLIIGPAFRLESANLNFRVEPHSWYGFYIAASENTTIMANFDIVSGGSTHLYIVDEKNFQDYQLNGSNFSNSRSYTFSENLTLNFLVPYSDTWYFLIWNVWEENAKHIVGAVIPSPDGFVGDSSGTAGTLTNNMILASAVIVSIVVCVYLIIKRFRPSIVNPEF